MFKALLTTAVAGLVALAGAPSANATEGDTAPIDIWMKSTHGVPGDTDYWYTRGRFGFSVLLTDIGEENMQGVTVFLSIPEELDVQSSGDGWVCEDTEGGVDCRHPNLVVPDEAWPELHFEAYSNEHIHDTIDVYATTGDYSPSHEGVTWFSDTSQ
jgi:hypothetical protein